MLLYNLVTELRFTQVLLVIGIEILTLVAIYLKVRPKTKTILLTLSPSFALALVLSLLSVSITQGFYSGMGYMEKSGWPLQFYNLWRALDNPIPFERSFQIERFIADMVYWGIFVFMIAAVYHSVKTVREKVLHTLIVSAIILLPAGSISLNNNLQKQQLLEQIPQPTSALTPPETTEQVMETRVSQKREAVEKAYPEFKDYEKKESFAGTEVATLEEDNDYYFVYKLLGSGLPIAKATCFRVDRMNTVYQIGTFPDLLDSYAGYKDINPKTCKGIK